ncbi:hypothetical protein GYMLUDRAFT_243588 [Collybiopsis luxurians FD-317 M1]|uniref:Uncharacterized protein n=1 Tax=Collybiopsis luxurians FD-317 M1 TaxID=944289 RepID=A0A0D0CQR8_9AGAR|nr:hypothetical protein GYMLUDRAFT_243588 [Collybiopsis luxurians FD-317 M1]
MDRRVRSMRPQIEVSSPSIRSNSTGLLPQGSVSAFAIEDYGGTMLASIHNSTSFCLIELLTPGISLVTPIIIPMTIGYFVADVRRRQSHFPYSFERLVSAFGFIAPATHHARHMKVIQICWEGYLTRLYFIDWIIGL